MSERAPRGAPLGAVLACLVGVGSASAQEAPPGRTAIVGVTVIDVAAGGALEERTVLLADGRIASIEPASSAPDSALAALRAAGIRVIDGRGRYLIPGLWDMHVHLRHPIAPELLMPQFIAHGVTGVRDMASDCDGAEESTADRVCIDRMLEWRRRIEAGELLGPRLPALSSFPLNPPWDYEVAEAEARSLVGRLAGRGVEWIKLYYRLSPEAFGWIVDEASKLGLRTGGHLPLRMTAIEASEAGLGSLEHARDFLFDCFPGSAGFRGTTRSQNPPMELMRAMVDEHDRACAEETFTAFVRNGTWYVPTHVTRRMDAYADDPEFRDDPRRVYIPAEAWESWQADADRMVALDSTPDGRRVMRRFYEEGLAITGRAHEAGVSIVLGTDAGDTYVFPGSGAHDELGELVKAGLTPAEALAAATVRAAEFLGLEEEHGTVDVGKVADLVLLGSDPLRDIAATRDIQMVIFRGLTLDRADLDGMLARVEEGIAAMDRP